MANILIVDDDKLVLKVVSAALTKFGHTCDAAVVNESELGQIRRWLLANRHSSRAFA